MHEKNTVGQRRTKFVVFFEYAKQIKDKKMLKKSFLPSKVMSICTLLLLPMAFIVEGISGQTTKFSSVYTDTTKQCKGEEPTFTCSGYGGYRIVLGVGGVFQNAQVESTTSDYTLSIAERQSVAWNPKVEWRMANGKPFAVIVRVDVNDENAVIPKKTGEQLAVLGLKGYENIAETIDAKASQANEKAREIADKGYGGGKSDAMQTDAAYTDGKAGLLNTEQIAKLAKLNAAIAVPSYIPEGYKLARFEIQPPEAHIIVFSLMYAGPAGKSFKIESNNEGLGDMAVKREVKGKSTYFLDSALETAEFYTGHDEHDANTVASEWLCSPKKYWPKTTKIQQCYQFLGNAKILSPDEVMKVMQSLRYLSR